MPDKDTPYQAEWMETLQHRPDPNRPDHLELPSLTEIAARLPQTAQFPSAIATLETRPASPMHTDGEPGYYDISILKPPVWKWQIAGYFFLGGLSAGAYLLARAADRTAGDQNGDVTRAGALLSLASFLPCPLLLIDDLGDPKRFHHMLRVFKPSTPMNLGTWTLVAYGGMVSAAAMLELLRKRNPSLKESGGATEAVTKTWLNLHDLVGIPLAVTVAGYTGVLLSCTANPLWCKNPWLGPLFSASAVSTGAEAISLAIDCANADSTPQTERAQDLLQTIDTAAHAAEGVAMVGFAERAGDKAKAFQTSGSAHKAHDFAVGALVVSEVLKLLPVSPKYRKPVRMLSAAAGLAAGLAMRWAMVYGGKEAAEDPQTARLASRATVSTSEPPEWSTLSGSF